MKNRRKKRSMYSRLVKDKIQSNRAHRLDKKSEEYNISDYFYRVVLNAIHRKATDGLEPPERDPVSGNDQ